MAKYFLKRLLIALMTLWVIITITFFLMHSIPGDPFADEKRILPEIRANLEAKYGLDKPLIEQYFIYMKNLLQGDLGISLKYKNRSINEMIATGFPVSLTLGGSAALVGISMGVIFGIVAGIKRGQPADYFVIFIAILGVSVPSFVFASLFQYFFAARLKLFPVAGWGGLIYLILPSLALGLRMIAYIARMMRTSMLDVLGQDYIKTAKSKGLNNAEIIAGHTVRNAITPIITVTGVQVAGILVGSFVIENIFNIPGTGKYLVNAVKDSDYTVILGMTVFYAAILVLMMFVIDMLYVLVDPRVKLQ